MPASLDGWRRSGARLRALLPVRHVAAFYGLHWETVKQIDKKHLQGTLGPVDFSGVETIVLDESVTQKSHYHATAIVESCTKQVL